MRRDELVTSPHAASPTAALAAEFGEAAFFGREAAEKGLRQLLLPLHFGGAHCVDFRCSIAVGSIGDGTIAELRLDASIWARRAEEITLAAAQLLQVLWQQAGRSRVRQGHATAQLEPGTWTVLDAGRESSIEFGHEARCLLLLVPKARLAGSLGAVDAIAGHALVSSGPDRIARSILETLVRCRPPADGRSEKALSSAVVALIEDALRLEFAQRRLPMPTRRALDLAEIQHYVTQRLDEKGLCTKRVAAAFRISRRSLYNVFSAGGTTPHTFIQQAKLARAAELLQDPDWHDSSVARIAEQCGYGDAAHFSRAFHAHFGAAPTAWRAQAG